VEIVIRATVVFLFLWAILRALGKRELAEMSAFELVLLIVMGDLVQQGITEEDMSVFGSVLAVGTLAIWVLVLSYLSFRSKQARGLIEGAPTVVVRDGHVFEEELAIERIPVEDLRGAARLSGIADLGHVKVALLEPDGRFSFIREEGAEDEDGSASPKHHEK